jgi:hypothetical protein
MTDSTPTDTPGPIAVKYKIIFYVVAWLAALFATDPSGGFWALAYMFPLGLAAFINVHWGNDGGWGVFAACYVIYLVHAWFYFRSRSKRSTFLLFAVLAVLLLCNIPGCHKMFPGH